VRKEYGHGDGLMRALDAFDLDVDRGETLAVMGPSGCGKSPPLRLIGGLDRSSAGELSVAGQTGIDGTGVDPHSFVDLVSRRVRMQVRNRRP
jgi:putative ABC transport system ATP-binding protein